MHFLTGGLGYIIPFLIVITPLVVVHELGHYLIARASGVRIEVFSIGFGPELFGWNDRKGTRWKVSALPIGGYVKMFGDADPSSMPGEAVETMTDEEKAVSLHYKPPAIRAAIVAAGPITNFIFPIVVLAVMYVFIGQPFTPPDIGLVEPGSPAEAAGIKPGDQVVSLNGNKISRFEDLAEAVSLNTGTPIKLIVRRGETDIAVTAVPHVNLIVDNFGNRHSQAKLGVGRNGIDYIRRDPATALWQAGGETWSITKTTMTGLWQMVTGARSADEIGGPLRIAKLSGEVAKGGALSLLSLMVLLSVNLGLINLFPIPILDGGHLLFYAAEALRGKPLGRRAQEIGFRIGLAFVLSLMVFATWNDLVQLHVVAFIKGLVT